MALCGSALRDDLGSESDVVPLVEFEPDRVPGLMDIAAIELELQALVGRPVDLRTPAYLSRYFRDAVTAEARQLHDAT